MLIPERCGRTLARELYYSSATSRRIEPSKDVWCRRYHISVDDEMLTKPNPYRFRLLWSRVVQSLTVPDPRCHPEPYGLTKSDSLSYSSEVPPPPDPLGPDQQQVTAQQRFSDAIRDLHTLAGKPSLREISKIIRERDDLPDTVSHEMVGQLLNGHIPKWSKVESIVRYLSERCLPPHNPDKEAVRFLALWGDATGSGSPAMEAMQEAQQTIIGATAFAERRRELEAKAERNTNEIDTALESFAQGASIDEVLKLANRLRSDSTDEDRRLLLPL